MGELELEFGIGRVIDGTGLRREHSGGCFYINEESVVVCRQIFRSRLDLGRVMSAHRAFSNQNEVREH